MTTYFNHYVKTFELPLNKKIKTFSKGMMMKASLTMALSHHAELIIMDEPTSGLDPIFRRELLEILTSVNARWRIKRFSFQLILRQI